MTNLTRCKSSPNPQSRALEDALAKVEAIEMHVHVLQPELSAVHVSVLDKAESCMRKVQNLAIKLKEELAVVSGDLAARDKTLGENLELLNTLRDANVELSEAFAASHQEVRGLKVELEIRTKTLMTSLSECEMQVEDSSSRMKTLLDFERQAHAEAAAKGGRLKTSNVELQQQTALVRSAADEAAEKLVQNVKRVAVEFMTKQTEIQRLTSKMELILCEQSLERDSTKHDCAWMMEQLTEYRAKLGEKGVKMSPRRSHRFMMTDSPGKFSPEKQEEEEVERLKEEDT